MMGGHWKVKSLLESALAAERVQGFLQHRHGRPPRDAAAALLHGRPRQGYINISSLICSRQMFCCPGAECHVQNCCAKKSLISIRKSMQSP